MLDIPLKTLLCIACVSTWSVSSDSCSDELDELYVFLSEVLCRWEEAVLAAGFRVTGVAPWSSSLLSLPSASVTLLLHILICRIELKSEHTPSTKLHRFVVYISVTKIVQSFQLKQHGYQLPVVDMATSCRSLISISSGASKGASDVFRMNRRLNSNKVLLRNIEPIIVIDWTSQFTRGSRGDFVTVLRSTSQMVLLRNRLYTCRLIKVKCDHVYNFSYYDIFVNTCDMLRTSSISTIFFHSTSETENAGGYPLAWYTNRAWCNLVMKEWLVSKIGRQIK